MSSSNLDVDFKNYRLWYWLKKIIDTYRVILFINIIISSYESNRSWEQTQILLLLTKSFPSSNLFSIAFSFHLLILLPIIYAGSSYIIPVNNPKSGNFTASFGWLAGLSLAGQLTHRNTVHVQIEQYFSLTTISRNSIFAYFSVLPNRPAVCSLRRTQESCVTLVSTCLICEWILYFVIQYNIVIQFCEKNQTKLHFHRTLFDAANKAYLC